MQGVESIQVIKVSAAITQGIGNELENPGGVVNIATKTPKFVNSDEVAIRTGSWGQFRPTFDVQNVLNKEKTVAFRINGAYERSDSYKKDVSMNRIYINPSIEWRPDDKTTVTLEMDYMDNNKTPDVGTVNLAADSVEALYNIPHNKFFGFSTNNVNNKTTTYAARINRKINNLFSIRGAFAGSSYQVDETTTNVNTKPYENKNIYNIRTRKLNRAKRDDKNSTVQLDFIGRDVYTGNIKHTFQIGFDYKKTNLETTAYNLYTKGQKGDSLVTYIDEIDVLGDVSNTLPTYSGGLWFTPQNVVASNSSSYGIMAQEVMTINQYLKAILGLRYSYQTSLAEKGTGTVTGDAWNPMFGVMVSPINNINLFGSYTTTTSLMSVAQLKKDKTPIGASVSKQWEGGIKSDWLDNRLRFNFTYFNIHNSNTSYAIYEADGRTISYYDNAGDLDRQGIEVELSGRVLHNLEVILGYAYVDVQYKKSPAYKEGSAPINTPKHTANGWVHYLVDKGPLKGLSAGVGVYYLGKRPVNDYTIKVFMHNTKPNVKPFDMPAYTTVNAQLAYTISKFTARVFFNNIFDKLGYNSYYRGGYINQIDPRNFAGSLSYRF